MPDTLDDSLLRLGALFKQQRYEQRKPAKDVAAAAGITPTYLWMLENGTNPKTGRPSRPSAEKLIRLARILDLDPTEVFELAGYPADEVKAFLSTSPVNSNEVNKPAPSALPVHSQITTSSAPTVGAPDHPAGRRVALRFGTSVAHPPHDGGRIPYPEPFIGRASDLQWLLDRLRPTAADIEMPGIAALRGIPGIGKSALAAVAVHRLQREGEFPDGIAVVRCEGVLDDTAILRQVLARFHPRRYEPQASDLPGLAEEAHRLLDERKALVVLDNIEPEFALGGVIAALRATGTAILLTARHRLPPAAVPSIASRAVPTLATAESEELFANSYGRANIGDLSLSELTAARRIVAALECHTMAVKLAGAYALDVGRDLAAFAQELEEDPARALTLPEGETLGAIRQTFETSYEALPLGAQLLFAALSLFANNDFGRHAALALADGLSLPNPEATLSLLVLRALLEASPNDGMAEGSDRERVHFHPLLRSLSKSKLATLPKEMRDAAIGSMAQFYAEYVTSNSARLNSTDAPNIEGTLEWAIAQHDSELTVRLCHGMQDYWRNRGRTEVSTRFLPAGIAAARRVNKQSGDREMRVRAASLELTYGVVLERAGELAEAEHVFNENLKGRRQMGDRHGEGSVLSQIGHLSFLRGNLKEAEGRYEQSLAIRREIGDRQGEGADLSNLGRIAEQRGQLEEAEKFYEQSLAIRREIGDRQGEGADLSYLGQIAQRRGQLEQAESYYRRSLAIRREVADRRGEGADLSSLGKVEMYRGYQDDAAAYYQLSLDIRRELQDQQGEGEVLANLGQVAQGNGNLEAAESYYKLSLTALRAAQDRQGEGVVLSNLGQVAQVRGQMQAAQTYYQQSLALLREVQDHQGEGAVLFHLAMVAESHGELNLAESLHRESLAIARDVQSKPDIAESLLSLGAFLLVHHQDRAEGGYMLREAIRLYTEMGLARANEARMLAQKYDCLE